MQTDFEINFANWLSTKKQFYIVPSVADYDQRISVVEKATSGEKLQSSDERNWAKSYAVCKVEGVDKLFHGDKQVIHRDEIFELLHASHIRLGHGDRDSMDKDLSKYYGLSR